jgi:hypothetical protein
MAKILIQTTAPDNTEWHSARFQKLATALRAGGHDVVSRDRTPDETGSDSVLSSLGNSDYDQLWLIAVDRGNGLSPDDVRGVLRFRERGGGVLSARDREDTGASLLNLGAIGLVNNFATYNRERSKRAGNASAGRCGPAQRIVPLEPVHDVFRSSKSPTGVVEYVPAHPHEGTISVPDDWNFARVIAVCDGGTHPAANVAIAIENEPGANGHPNGRALAVSTFRQFADESWEELREDRQRLDVFEDYLRNIARWLTPASAGRP